ncbi:MAG TPA: hypothetical protein VN540_02410 [Clostridia bacterium]|nr:hypothetical protein [Clostridia bacterium]
MQYRHSKDDNFDDLACGKALIGRAGFPNFPVRLAQEMFGRCLNYLGRERELCVYDPCCGGGYLLAVLGFLNLDKVAAFAASDIDAEAVALARDNLSLLTREGLKRRLARLEELYALHGKESHREAAAAARRLMNMLPDAEREVERHVFQADILRESALDGQAFRADVVVTDVPYGGLTSWQGGREGAGALLDRLVPILKQDSVVAVCADKGQKFASPRFRRLEHQSVGKRAFAIFALKE